MPNDDVDEDLSEKEHEVVIDDDNEFDVFDADADADAADDENEVFDRNDFHWVTTPPVDAQELINTHALRIENAKATAAKSSLDFFSLFIDNAIVTSASFIYEFIREDLCVLWVDFCNQEYTI